VGLLTTMGYVGARSKWRIQGRHGRTMKAAEPIPPRVAVQGALGGHVDSESKIDDLRWHGQNNCR